MSVLIKGMEMPKDDYVVMTLYPSGNCYLYYKGCGGIAKKAEVIEVPPHGRLIDADEMLQFLVETFGEEVKAGFAWKTISEHCITIIEAEGT